MAVSKTWAQVTRDAEAMDEIREIIGEYLPEGDHKAAMSRIIGAVERKTGYQFITSLNASEQGEPKKR